MTQPYEARHRELREALSPTVAGLNDELLAEFDRRTGPLVDGPIASVRVLRDAPRDGTVDIAAIHRRLYDALAALDEASRG